MHPLAELALELVAGGGADRLDHPPPRADQDALLRLRLDPQECVDDDDPLGERELGDVFICPEYTVDLLEAVVHGVLHLTGMDHEVDDGEMLALQAEIMGWMR